MQPSMHSMHYIQLTYSVQHMNKIHTSIRMHRHIHTHARMHTHTHTHTHACTHTHARIHTHIHTHANINVNIRTALRTYSYYELTEGRGVGLLELLWTKCGCSSTEVGNTLLCFIGDGPNRGSICEP